MRQSAPQTFAQECAAAVGMIWLQAGPRAVRDVGGDWAGEVGWKL